MDTEAPGNLGPPIAVALDGDHFLLAPLNPVTIDELEALLNASKIDFRARALRRVTIEAYENPESGQVIPQRAWGDLSRDCEDFLKSRAKSIEVLSILTECYINGDRFRDEVIGVHPLQGLRESLVLVSEILPQVYAQFISLDGAVDAAALSGVIDDRIVQDALTYSCFWKNGDAGTPWYVARAMSQVGSLLTEQQTNFRDALLLLLDEVAVGLDTARQVLGSFDGRPELLPKSAASIADYRADVVRLLGERPPSENESAPVTRAGEASAVAVQAPMTRDTALNQLTEIAAFFVRTEPQSVVGPALRELVRRGRMDVYALLREMIPDDGDRATALQRLGLREPEEDAHTT